MKTLTRLHSMIASMRYFSIFQKALAAALLLTQLAHAAEPLATLEYRITGTSLQISPAAVAVPKGIAGSVMVSILAGGGTNSSASAQLASGAYIEATLRGPAFPEPRRLVGQPNAPLLFPSISLVGDYSLDAIRLVDGATGETRLEGSPASVPVRVFDEVLVSRVTSRPLTHEEIQEKGIAIDESNFRAVEFEVAFVLDGQTIPVRFPVVSPKFVDATELIPAAELEARLKEAAAINQQIANDVVQLPPEFEVANLNIQVQGINFQAVDPAETPDLELRIPPIPALMVIPGNIGYLNQFFSVQIFTENAAPLGSGLTVRNIQARLALPPGPDRIVSTNYATPGDDPLRFARIGPEKLVQPVQTIVQPGPDKEIGTSDDIATLRAGEAGEAEFLVEGLQEGLHVMDLDLSADLEGLAAGAVKVKGKAAGSVLVRNPRFSMAFSHPRTVRAGEPYEASVTLLNTGLTPANLVSVSLNRNSISGAVFEPGQEETVQLGNLRPGQSATATFRMRSQRTGAVSFSNLTTSDDSVTGRFRLSMGVDERGVALSPDTIAMPDFVERLPAQVLAAANRVLGQALSVATAGQVPAGVARVARSTVTRRVLELAEAGQRLRYGDPLSRVLPDLLRDWQGGRLASDGFDQILRVTDAGAEWRAAIFGALELDGLGAVARMTNAAPDFSGLGQAFVVASGGAGALRFDANPTNEGANAESSAEPYSLVYAGTNGNWGVTPAQTNGIFSWTFTNAPARGDLGVLIVDGQGQSRQLVWSIENPDPSAIYRFHMQDSLLRVVKGGNETGTLIPIERQVQELPPSVIAVEQDLSVIAGRPANPCNFQDYLNYGTVVAAVFSKPVTQESAGKPQSYLVDGDNGANSVQIQPSGRVALLNLRKGISAIRPRTLTVTNVADPRGNILPSAAKPIRSVVPGTEIPFTGGVAVRGRVLKGDGSVAAGVPVTLTMYDQFYGPFGCESWIRRVSQIFTDERGAFDLDFVMAGIPYSISATDTTGLSEEAISVVLESTLQQNVDRQHIENLANSAATRDSLLGLFAAGSLPEAIAKIEGVDRALARDFVPAGSGREGQEVPMALRFRGRAIVAGKVVAEDGATPISGAAVNLFPDSASREQGRGLFSDSEGRFAFFGVPLGIYSVDVKTPDRRARTVAGVLTIPGQTTNLVIALPTNAVFFGSIRGRVFEADNLTPHGGGRVFIGRYEGSQVREVARIVEADAEGFWEAAELPIREYDAVAVTFDGKRKGVREKVIPGLTSITYANVTLEAVTRVFGRVQFDDGRPAPNALVAGGASLVRTDANGNFQLEGVPVGRRDISAGLERDPAAGRDFPKLGTTSAQIVSGADNFVVVKLRSAGRIFGKVLNAQGVAVPNVRVAIPQDGGFFWTDADSSGNYVFENLPLGAYTISAPANAVAPTINESALIAQIRTGDEEEILAALEEAVAVFVGAEDPLITGEHLRFRPSSWGFTTAQIRFDGDSANANIRYIPQGTVSGRVLNHQGVPIGARVRLTGLGPTPSGAPSNTLRGERDSDPATGEFIFPGQLLAGPWSLQTASPFYPVILRTNGFTTELNPDVTNIVLQFPPTQEVNGRIAGRVLLPDGAPVGAGALVRINISDDYEIQTDTNGLFDTQIAFPALGRSYTVQAFDPVSGLRGIARVNMTPGITNLVDVPLLTRSSAVEVLVLRGNGQPAAGALVTLDHGSYPNEQRISGNADSNGRVRFSGLWEGKYAAAAQYSEGSTRVFARAGGTAGPNGTLALTLQLGGTGVIEGRFVKRDLVTPVEAAQVTIGSLGFASTDSAGRFRFEGVPLGTYRIVTADPVTGASATGSAVLSAADQVVSVELVEALRGEVSGYVLNSFGSGFTPGAAVTINYSDGLTPSRTVTTGPDGGFVFPGSPMGTFTLRAQYELPGRQTVNGSASGVLTDAAPSVSADIQLQRLGILPVVVLRSDGATPAANTRVTLGSQIKDSDAQGRVTFENLPLGGYTVTAISRTAGELRNGAVTSVTVAMAGTNAPVSVVLAGVGAIEGTVLRSDGSTPALNAEVVVQFQKAPFSGETVSALTDTLGRFAFAGAPVGAYRLVAASQSLAASVSGLIERNGLTNRHTLRLGDSGSITGRLVRATAVLPSGGVDVGIEFDSQSQNAGRSFLRTGPDGAFIFENVPLGPFRLTSFAPLFGGIVDLTASLTNNGQVLNLGALVFDEEFPRLVQVTPAPNAVDVPITTMIDLLFSEALASNSVTSGGIILRGSTGVVSSAVNLLADTNGVRRLVRMTPNAPLVSERTYEIIVVSGDLLGPNGNATASGPRDLVGRPIPATFSSRFTTADNDPPVLLSLFPTNGAVQIDPRAVPRLSFNEPLRVTGFVFQVVGPAGPVAGSAAVGVNGQTLSFVPAVELSPNVTYSLVVSNIFDLAGNRASGEPFRSSFQTLDTVGPNIASLDLVGGSEPVAGATVQVVASLAQSEIGANVRFTQDFEPVGSALAPPYRASLVLPQSGVTTVRAIATDLYGNDGPVAELRIVVRSNTAPSIQFTRVTPVDGPVASGAQLVVDVTAFDDNGVAELRVLALGLDRTLDLSTNTTRVRVAGTVPAGTGPGQSVQISAQARDASNLSSGEQLLVVPISDGTAPTLSLAPFGQTEVRAGTQLPVSFVFGDNFGVTMVDLAVTGAFITNLQAAISPALTNGTNTLLLAIPQTLPSNGEPVRLRLVARDAAGNSSSPALFDLRVADQIRPVIESRTPDAGAANIDIAQIFRIRFSEPIDTNTVSPQTVSIRSKTNGVIVPAVVSFQTNFTTISIDPVELLAIDTDYLLALDRSIADLDGNTLGTNVVFEFRTADFRLASPADGTNVIEGQSILLQAAASALQFAKVRYLADGIEIALVSTAPHMHTFVVPALASLATNRIVFRAQALSAENAVLAEATSTVSVLSGTLDSDGDGISNADEIARGTDPFQPNRAPTLTVPAALELADGVRTNFSVAAFDADGNLRRFEVRESSTDDDLKWFDLLAFQESGGRDYTPASAASNGIATVMLQISRTNEPAAIVVRAVDSDGLSVSRVIAVTVLPDLDRDGIPDRDDPDIDGDNLSNAEEISLGTNPRKPDSDDDGIADGEEVIAGADGFVTNPLNPNSDGDALDDGTEVALGLSPSNPSDGTEDVVISNRTVTLFAPARFRSLELTNGAVLTHPATGLGMARALDLTVQSLVIDSTSRIDVNSRGYLGAISGPNNSGVGRTLDNSPLGSTRRNGGSYGGLGSIGSAEQKVNSVYGSFADPAHHGSGGGSDSGPAGNGGGLVRIAAKSVVLEGQILADGGAGSRYAGGGSGGGIRLSAESLTGSGRISASGGRSGGDSGGGGGGRIAIYLTNSTALTDFRAYGGTGGMTDGSAGTIYLQAGTQPSLLVVDAGRTNNLAYATPLYSLAGGFSTYLSDYSLSDRAANFLPGSLEGLPLQLGPNATRTFRIIGNSATTIFTDPADGRLTDFAAVGSAYKADLSAGRVYIQKGASVELRDGDQARAIQRGVMQAVEVGLGSNARLTHPRATIGAEHGIELNVSGTLTIDPTSEIDARALGYLGGLNSGTGSTGRTLGNTSSGASMRRNGGSHGGLGAFGSAEQFANAVYGDFQNPDAPGSGGGSDSGPGGAGGGVIRLNADTLLLEGAISADGGRGSRYAGGGSGGSIKLSVNRLQGDGQITADGGDAGGDAGGGGGGRIALFFRSSSAVLTNIQALGGAASDKGAPGTIYLQSFTTKDLIVRGTGRETPLPTGSFDHRLTIDQATVSGTVIGVLDLVLTNSAVLTHASPVPGSDTQGLRISADRMMVSESSAIRVSGRGYPGGERIPGAGGRGWTFGNTNTGSVRRNGGSYGGLGGNGTAEQYANDIYGTYRDPRELGSGGGSDAGPGGNGGGHATLNVGALELNGTIEANGLDGSRYAGGGSGGSIRITVSQLSGAGSILANGGAAGAEAGGGGGGRVAVYFDSVSDGIQNRLQAFGGTGLTIGGPGTLYLKGGATPGRLIVAGMGRETPLPEGSPDDELVVEGATVSALNLRALRLELTFGAVLTHPGATLTNEPKLQVTADTVFVSTNSRIDLTARGYLGGFNGANGGLQEGRTLGNQPGSARRTGGSHGGLGAFGNLNNFVSRVYGDYRNPSDLGSGGGSDSGPAGSGGGALRLIVRSVVLDGQILANGGNGSRYAAGGSGGAVFISADSLSGAGAIRANGGNAGVESGGGGGGRIGLEVVQPLGIALTNIQAIGGTALNDGGPGTIYTKEGSASAALVVRGHGRETPLPVSAPTERWLIDGATVSATNLSLAALTLTNNSVLTHPPTTENEVHRLTLSLTQLRIATDSRIDVSARGYLGGLNAGNPAQSGRTYGNVSGSVRRNGGSHGGAGGWGTAELNANSVYGSFSAPAEAGSGGGSDSGPAGNGGGIVKIVAQTFILDGAVQANGGSGARYAGGGSGGAIDLEVSFLSGTGLISANGGSSGPEAGGGGGGRIASKGEILAIANITAWGGSGGYTIGSPGTIYLETASAKELIIRAGGANKPQLSTPLLSLAGQSNTQVASHSLIDTNASFVPGGLIGLELNPNITQFRTFLVISNTSTEIFIDPASGELTSVAQSGSRYSADFEAPDLVIRDGAIVSVIDGDEFRADRKGALRARNVSLLDDSRLTHPAATTVQTYGLDIAIEQAMNVDASSRVDASGLGYVGTTKGGNGSSSGYTLGNMPTGGSTRRNGGSHGGFGGIGNLGGNLSALYGDADLPELPGSGGGSDSGPGGSGGGAIKIIADVVRIEGGIWSNGESGSRYGGGGSGGSILLGLRQLAGSGSIQAHGGQGGAESGGGGGGRVAVLFTENSSFAPTSIDAAGGAGFSNGSIGSVVVRQVGSLSALGENLAVARILSINVSANQNSLDLRGQSAGRSNVVTINWQSSDAARIEWSSDLVHWSRLDVPRGETGPNMYRAQFLLEGTSRFFRLDP